MAADLQHPFVFPLGFPGLDLFFHQPARAVENQTLRAEKINHRRNMSVLYICMYTYTLGSVGKPFPLIDDGILIIISLSWIAYWLLLASIGSYWLPLALLSPGANREEPTLGPIQNHTHWGQ